jgi:hypothetical protein
LIEINNKIPNSWKLIDDAAATLPNIPYASLSHCWGQIPLLRLTRATVSEMKRGMSISSLPKPFQDALTVTKYFSISHIWIDSLCILQDSIQDWQQESMKMREVYTYADFNIAATTAAQGKDGCFFDRPVSKFKLWTVKPEWVERKNCVVIDINAMKAQIFHATLNRLACCSIWGCKAL